MEYAYYTYPDWQTAEGWDQECYYSTIQTADLDGDGKDEIIGRSSDGLEIWSMNDDSTLGEYLATLSDLSDAGGWAGASYYVTIQTGDLDGDGAAEIIARGADGIVAWSFDAANNSFTQLAGGPAWSDDAGWNNSQYQWYGSIGLVDLDGDGAKELVGRDSRGLMALKYDAGSDSWTQLATLAALADGTEYMPTFDDDASFYQTAIETLSCGNVISTGTASEEVAMVTYSAGLAVFQYDASSDSWTTNADNSGYFDAKYLKSGAAYQNSIQLYEKYIGSGNFYLAAENADGLGLYEWTSDGWSLMETLDQFSGYNG